MNNTDSIIVDFPQHLKGLAEAVEAIKKEVEDLRHQHSTGGAAIDYEVVEKRFADMSAAIEREAHGATLSSLDVQAARVEINGRLCYPVIRRSATYNTLAGGIEVTRTLYREVGERNGPTLDPIALRVGALNDYWLPGTAKAIAHELQKGTSREAEVSARQVGRLPYSRSSMERVGHSVGALFVAVHARIEDELIDEMEMPEGAASISVSVDRVSIPMEEPRSRPRGRPRKNAPKNPVERVYRMAYCATTTIHDCEGRALKTLRNGWMPGTDKEAISEVLGRNVMSLRIKAPHLRMVLLADGAEDMWNIMDQYVNEFWQGEKPTRLVDFWHVIEKLGNAAKVIFPSSSRKKELRRWKNLLLRRASGASMVLQELLNSGKREVWVGDDRPVHAAITYLENHDDRMSYRRARKNGLPIGSGNVEATCKSLVSVRMKRPGARWKEVTGQEIMTLRAAGLSDIWDPAISRTLASLRVPVRPRRLAI